MTDNFVWTPPGLGPEATEDFLTTTSGIPPHAREELLSWLDDSFPGHSSYRYAQILTEYQSARRTNFGFRDVGLVTKARVRKALGELDDQELAYFADYQISKLYRVRSTPVPDTVRNLASILRRSGAGWEVAHSAGRFRLQEVLPGGVRQVVREVITAAAGAGELLARSWEGAFGAPRNPSAAYADAIRAVESLSCPIFSPSDSRATLGKDINVLRNSPQKFTVVLNAGPDGSEFLLSMMKLLWHSQSSRHGSEDYKDVTEAEAQAAVLLAATLVGWFAKGFASRKEGEDRPAASASERGHGPQPPSAAEPRS